MDFIDLEAFSVIDASAESASHSTLPEPSSMLDLSSLPIDSHTNEGSFKIPDLYNRQKSTHAGKENLYDRMAQHASMLMDKVNIKTADTEGSRISTQQKSLFMEPTKASLPHGELKSLAASKNLTSEVTSDLLLRKLSNILNEYTLTNYKARADFRKSLKLLEENREKLQLDENRLIDPGFVGNLARKSMRSGLENELLKEHLSVLEELRPIIRRIKRLSSPIEKIQASGQIFVEDQRHEPEKEDQSVAQGIEELRSNVNHLKLKKTLLCSLKEHFTLTQVEDDHIMNGPVDITFFEIVDKAMKIKEDTAVLLALPNSAAASSLINRINQILDSTSRKVFNYLLDFLYSYEYGPNSSGQSTSLSDLMIFHRSVVCLSNDMGYFEEFSKRVTGMRSKSILDEFLSQFDYNPNDSRPILLSAGDPLRYIGDVLASVHASIANEADFLKSLFKVQSDRIIPKSPHNKQLLSGLDTKLLNEIVKSLANPSRIRVEQVIRFEDSPAIHFEVIRLLDLYQLMYNKQGLNTDNIMVTNLKTLQDVSKTRIEDLLTKSLSNIPTTAETIKHSMPPEWLFDYINKLVELFEAHEQGGNFERAENGAVVDEAFLQNFVLNPIDDVLMKRVQQDFPLARKNEEARLSLLSVQINCLDLIKSRLQPFANSLFSRSEKAIDIWKNIERKTEDVINRMLDLQFKVLLDKTGLSLYYNLLNMIFPIASVEDELDYDMYLSLSDNPLMNLETINEKVNKRLNEYVPQALTDIQDNLLFKLMSPTIADYICETCLTKLCVFYVTFRKVLMHLYPGKIEDITEVLNFSEVEFKALVGVQQV